MENAETPFKAGLNTGLILGIATVLITFIIYFIDPARLASISVGLFILLGLFIAMIFFGIQYRKSIGGFIEFGPAFNYAFIALLVSSIIGMIGNLVLYYVVDPALPGVLAESQIETTLGMMERFGAADAITSDQIDEIRENALSSYTIVGQIKTVGFGAIFSAILSLILGAIIKKRDKSLDY